MARSSKQLTPAQVDAPSKGINERELEAAGVAMAADAQRLAVIEQRFGVDMPYNLDLYIARIKINAAESAARLIEIGQLLIQIREHEPKGKFHAAVEEIGFGIRFAQRAMQAAAKLQDRPRLAGLGTSKALELLSEDDDTLAELEDGGTVAGLTLDDIDTMTVRELKATLRAERKEHEEEKAANEEIIHAKDQRINKLTRDKRRDTPESKLREEVEQLLRDVDECAVEAASHIARMRAAIADIHTRCGELGLQVDGDVQSRLEQNLSWCSNQLRDLADDLGE